MRSIISVIAQAPRFHTASVDSRHTVFDPPWEDSVGGDTKLTLLAVLVSGAPASVDLLRCVWVDQAKTLVFALGERGIHAKTPLLGETLSLWYEAGRRQRASGAETSYEARLAEESANIRLRRCSTPEEVGVACKGLPGS